MSLRIIPVRRAYASLSCDWPGCPERMDLSDRPMDPDRDYTELRALRLLADRRGWRFQDGEATCPNHPREAA